MILLSIILATMFFFLNNCEKQNALYANKNSKFLRISCLISAIIKLNGRILMEVNLKFNYKLMMIIRFLKEKDELLGMD